MRTSRILVASTMLMLALGACGSDAASPPAARGTPTAARSTPSSSPAPATPIPSVADTLSPLPPASAATPSASAPATKSPTPAGPFTLRSGAFPPGGAIPPQYTCDGTDVSPDLSWTGVPDGTGALVLVVDDPDAEGFVHWLVLDMPPDQPSLAEGAGTSFWAVQQGTNDFGAAAWGGPCPPSGNHRYRFTLYALAAPLGLHDAPAGGPVREALGRSDVLGRAVLTAHYRRGG